MKADWFRQLSGKPERPASFTMFVPVLAAANGAISWWAAVAVMVFVVILLVLAVCWMAKYTDASEVKSPLLTWKRRDTARRRP